MNEFENKLIRDVHASRYIASWGKMGGHFGRGLYGRFDFQEWLESMGLEPEEVYFIYNLATCGRMELETSARKYIKGLME
jgi:hypothetical protein